MKYKRHNMNTISLHEAVIDGQIRITARRCGAARALIHKNGSVPSTHYYQIYLVIHLGNIPISAIRNIPNRHWDSCRPDRDNRT